MSKKKRHSNPKKQQVQQLRKVLKNFYEDFDPVFEKAKDYWDKVIAEWKTTYEIVVESCTDGMIKRIEIFNQRQLLQKYPQAIDELIARFTIKYWTLAWVMYAEVLSEALNKIHWYKKYKWSDFYIIDDSVVLTKKEKETLKIVAKRNWEIFIW